MEKQEAQEILVIVLAYALSNPNLITRLPNAVVVIFRHTHIADRAMFRSSRFDQLASLAFIILLVQNLIIILIVSEHVFFDVQFGHLPRRDWASFIINPEADNCEDIG
jgi:hypothetical protein